MRLFLMLVVALSFGCSKKSSTTEPDAGASVDAGANVDAGVSTDAGANVDAAITADAGESDAGSEDGGTDSGVAVVDASMPSDAGEADAGDVDAGDPDGGAMACHDWGYVAPPIGIERSSSPLPALGGGPITDGNYDAVSYQTTFDYAGSYQGTWAIFGERVDVLDRPMFDGMPPYHPIPFSYTWSTMGNRLTREPLCGDDVVHIVDYGTENIDGDVYLTIGNSDYQIRMRLRR